MRQQDRQPAPDGDPEGWVSRTWEAIEPYQARTGYRLGRAQLSDGHTTESELCAHPWLSESRPGHDNQPAARACGDALAARLRAAHNDPASDPQ